MAENVPAVAEYVDANGNTWQLDDETAKRLGYKRASTKAVAADSPAVSNKSVKPRN